MRCEACRRVHSKVQNPPFLTYLQQCHRPYNSDICVYCKKRGIECVMKWGPKKEMALQLAKEFPTPPEAVVSQDEGRRLQYLMQHPLPSTLYGLVQKAITVYGKSISCPSLRLAILSVFDNVIPFENRCEEHLLDAVSIIAKKNLSTLEEGDLIAIAFLSKSTSLYLSRNRYTSHAKLPAYSVHLRWFVETMKDLLQKTNGDVMTHPLGEFWVVLTSIIIDSFPVCLQGDSFWELCALRRQIPGLDSINSEFTSNQKLLALLPKEVTPPDFWQMGYAWYTFSNRWFKTTLLAFSTALPEELGHRFEKSLYMRSALEDVRTEIESHEASELRTVVLSDLFSDAPYPEVEIPLHWGIARLMVYLNIQSYIHLLLALMLDAPTIQMAVTSPDAAEHALSVISGAKNLLFDSTGFNHKPLGMAVLFTFIATLVHPISQFDEGTPNV